MLPYGGALSDSSCIVAKDGLEAVVTFSSPYSIFHFEIDCFMLQTLISTVSASSLYL